MARSLHSKLFYPSSVDLQFVFCEEKIGLRNEIMKDDRRVKLNLKSILTQVHSKLSAHGDK